MKKRYFIHTWDAHKEKFTPQAGVKCGPMPLWSVRRVLRELRSMGYQCDRGDPSVLVFCKV